MTKVVEYREGKITARTAKKPCLKIVGASVFVFLSLIFFATPSSIYGSESELNRLTGEVSAFFERGEYDKAIVSAEKLLELTIRMRGEDHEETAMSMYNLAGLYNSQGKYAAAEPLFLRSLKISEKLFGPNHPTTAVHLGTLALLFLNQDRFDEAEPLFVRALKICEKQLGPDHLDTARALNQLAGLYKYQGRYEESEPLFLRSLKIREEQLGPDHASTSTSLNNLASLYEAQGNYAAAEPLFLRSLKISEKQLGSDHPDTATHLGNLALLYLRQGRNDESEALFLRSLKISEQQLGSFHPDTATSLSNLAMLYAAQGRYEEAEPLYLRSLRIREEQLGADHSDTAMSLASLAEQYLQQGRNSEAEPLFLRCLNIHENKLGPNHPTTATSLAHLAGLYSHQGRYEEAEPLYLRSLKIREELGPDSPDTARAMSNLATLYHDNGHYEEAEPLILRSLEINEKKLGSDHPDTATTLNSLGLLYIDQGRYDEAAPIFERSMISAAAHWRRMLAYFSERECLTFQRFETPFTSPGNQGSGRLAAEAQLLFKGAVIEAMNTRRVAEEQLARTEKGQELLRQRESLRPRYHLTLLAKGGNSDEAKSLQTQFDELDKKAIALVGSRDLSASLLSIGLQPVQESLSETTCLVESFRYIHGVDLSTSESRYASTIITPNGDPVFLSHGDAKSIELAITNYRAALQTSPGDETRTPEERAAQLREAETALYTGILAPLEAHLKPGETVIFSPDAQWHFLPLGMLRNAAGETFSSRYQVRYVSSGRDLVKSTPPRDGAKQSALVLGNPTFRNNAPLLALAETEEGSEKALLASTLRAGLAQDSGSIQFSPLPGTAREASLLAERLGSSGYEVNSLTGEEATEAALMKAIQGHSIVHLATHGFFLNEIKDDTKDAGPQLSDLEERKPNLASIQNPMYRSGLALSGAQSTFNLWQNGQVPPPSRDGVLLAAEMATLDLRGTDLVVLSACETAAGEALDGEGVIGLRRALNAAGATNVIMTLWPVDDEATVELMEVFYEKYLAGMPAGKALAETQRELFPKWIELHGEVGALARLAPFICTSLGKVE